MSAEVPPSLSARQVTGDAVLATMLTAFAVWVQVAVNTGTPGNHAPDVLAVLLTVTAVAPLALRRVRSLAVLGACVSGLVLLVWGQYAVGATSPGSLIAFYTCVAWGTRREARAAVPVLLAGIGTLLLLQPLDITAEGSVIHLAAFFGAWLVGAGVRERRELGSARAGEARQAVELAQQQTELAHERASRAAAEERLRITRELHDVLGHALSVVVVQASAAEQLLESDLGAARQALADIAGTGRSSLADIRQVLGRLREDEPTSLPPVSPSLIDLPELVQRVEAAGLPVRLHLDFGPEAILPGVGLATYRVVQEALTNVLKHAGTSTAWVSVARDGAVVNVEVRDDGVGSSSSVEGNGLAGMRERVSAYGGQLDTGPADGGGYLVRARIPVTDVRRVDAT
jgi:signal transduction histidine kinase